MVARLPLPRRLKIVVVLFTVAFGVPPTSSTVMMERHLDLVIFSPALSEDGLTLSLTGLGWLFVYFVIVFLQIALDWTHFVRP